MKLSQAQNLAERIIETMQPFCQRAAIAGSIRRQKPEVKDSEFRLTGRDSLCPDGASFVSTMPPSPSSVFEGAGSERQSTLSNKENQYGRN